MSLIFGEYGGAIRSAIIGMLVITIIMTGVKLLSKVMPVFNDEQAMNNEKYIKDKNEYSCTIDANQVIYIDFMSEIKDLKTYLITNMNVSARDYDGKNISKDINVKGTVDTNEKGLYTVYVEVTNDKGYCAGKKINIIVEESL